MDDTRPMGEVWWIWSDRDEPWAGLRIAHFGKAKAPESGGRDVEIFEVFFILGETPYRSGLRIWNDVAEREGWRKVEQIKVPDIEACRRA